MPRYFFHLHNDVEARDEEGVELPDLEAARRHAASNALFTLGETAKEQGQINLAHRIDIEDSDGNVLATVHFRDVIRIDG